MLTDDQWREVFTADRQIWGMANRTAPAWAGTADIEEVRDYGVDEAIKFAVAWRPGEGRFGWYIRRFLPQRMLTVWRRKAHRKAIDSAFGYWGDSTEDGEAGGDVARLLDGLTAGQRNVAEAVAGVGGLEMTVAEYAASAGIGGKAASDRWHRAKRAIKSRLSGGLATGNRKEQLL